jgi:hypothetical protein
MIFAIYGLDSSNNCGSSANLDLVRYIWQNFERFNFIKYAMVLVRPDPSFPVRLLCLRYYRAQSDWWRDNVDCIRCLREYQDDLRPMTGCKLPDDCDCRICTRQPPSLLSLASNTLFNLVLDIDRFVLSNDTTYEQYVHVATSGRVPLHKLIPPEYPVIRIAFRADAFTYKLHHDCPGRGSWVTEMGRYFPCHVEAVRSLIHLPTMFWCRNCAKGLFFSTKCSTHNN